MPRAHRQNLTSVRLDSIPHDCEINVNKRVPRNQGIDIKLQAHILRIAFCRKHNFGILMQTTMLSAGQRVLTVPAAAAPTSSQQPRVSGLPCAQRFASQTSAPRSAAPLVSVRPAGGQTQRQLCAPVRAVSQDAAPPQSTSVPEKVPLNLPCTSHHVVVESGVRYLPG